jgi:hypothetical protein
VLSHLLHYLNRSLFGKNFPYRCSINCFFDIFRRFSAAKRSSTDNEHRVGFTESFVYSQLSPNEAGAIKTGIHEK